MNTFTNTRFFNEELIEKLQDVIKQIGSDWDTRRDFVESEIRDAGDARMSILAGITWVCDEAAS